MQDEPVQLATAAGIPWIEVSLWQGFRRGPWPDSGEIDLPAWGSIPVIAHHRSMRLIPANQPFLFSDSQPLDALALEELAATSPVPLLRKQSVSQSIDDAPLVRYVRHLLTEAVIAGASDLHLIPESDGLTLWFRIDGQLVGQTAPPAALAPRILARLKVMANLDLTETGQSQDGALHLITGQGLECRFRISIVPALHGEKAVLRVIEGIDQIPSLDALGLTERQRACLQSAIQEPSGLILLTGPTGSGKSQTLSRIMLDLARADRHVIALEDPIERILPGVQQIQVNSERGFGFSHGLRALLRQDPDVLMVGEIRDQETAIIAAQAAQTGHLVLSTLHTRQVDDVPDRLAYLGVPHHLTQDSLRLIGAQRLVRRRCTHCQGSGCGACHDGYRGRSAVFDLWAPGGARHDFIHAAVDAIHTRRTTREELHRVLPQSLHREIDHALVYPHQSPGSPDAPENPRKLALERSHADRESGAPQPNAGGTSATPSDPICRRHRRWITAGRGRPSSSMALDRWSTDRPNSGGTERAPRRDSDAVSGQ